MAPRYTRQSHFLLYKFISGIIKLLKANRGKESYFNRRSVRHDFAKSNGQRQQLSKKGQKETKEGEG